MSEPLALTVIIVTYNHEKSIARAIDSVLAQKTNFAFNIKVFDDCSTDDTQNIIAAYVQSHGEKIECLFSDNNLGPAENMRRAFSNIQTEYWAYLEGDDYWCDEKKLQLQLDVLNSHKECTLCAHNTLIKLHSTGEKRFYLTAESQKYKLEERMKTHPCSRVYRNVVDFTDLPPELSFDVAIQTLHMIHGELYLIDRVMNVWNVTGEGLWTGSSKRKKQLQTFKNAYVLSKYLGFQYDNLVSPKSKLLALLKHMLGLRAGWIAFLALVNLLASKNNFRQN